MCTDAELRSPFLCQICQNLTELFIMKNLSEIQRLKNVKRSKMRLTKTVTLRINGRTDKQTDIHTEPCEFRLTDGYERTSKNEMNLIGSESTE